jgi:hypothetical protein
LGIREKLNENPAITTGATVLIIVIAVGFIIYSQLPTRGPKPPSQAYFSVDDGKTWFADDVKKMAPFDKDGKPAVRVHLYKCGKNAPFVAYLERYIPEAKKQLEKIQAAGGATGPEVGSQISMIMQNGVEYKKPGDPKWIKMSDDYQSFGRMMSVTCPDANDTPEPVEPD